MILFHFSLIVIYTAITLFLLNIFFNKTTKLIHKEILYNNTLQEDGITQYDPDEDLIPKNQKNTNSSDKETMIALNNREYEQMEPE
jgi:hypothetical protein